MEYLLNINKGAVVINTMKNIYQENGYKDRKDYLNSMAEEFDVPITVVLSIANMLGPNEDFDGLVSALEDAENML